MFMIYLSYNAIFGKDIVDMLLFIELVKVIEGVGDQHKGDSKGE